MLLQMGRIRCFASRCACFLLSYAALSLISCPILTSPSHFNFPFPSTSHLRSPRIFYGNFRRTSPNIAALVVDRALPRS
ncbi:hypothetical protein C8R46DRAFT_1068072 [Mycena filopes]|nr:hypothetical protein C8R46DRAFT_1068072 [Mycena filopes]